jgi:hypothetical protein
MLSQKNNALMHESKFFFDLPNRTISTSGLVKIALIELSGSMTEPLKFGNSVISSVVLWP